MIKGKFIVLLKEKLHKKSDKLSELLMISLLRKRLKSGRRTSGLKNVLIDLDFKKTQFIDDTLLK